MTIILRTFTLKYAGSECMVDIINGCVMKGSLPARQLKLVLAWNELHQDELMQNWELAKESAALNQVDPL